MIDIYRIIYLYDSFYDIPYPILVHNCLYDKKEYWQSLYYHVIDKMVKVTYAEAERYCKLRAIRIYKGVAIEFEVAIPNNIITALLLPYVNCIEKYFEVRESKGPDYEFKY